MVEQALVRAGVFECNVRRRLNEEAHDYHADFPGYPVWGIFGWKLFTSFMTKRYMAKMQAPAVTVSTMKVQSSPWQSRLKGVGTLTAIVGVNVTTELAGMVQKIYFTPGATVTEGTVLVQLNADAEIGQLHSLQAQTELAKITYQRDKAQYAVRAVSKQQVDTDEWNLKNLQGQTAQQAATVAKKTLRAPFSGRLGISQVNPGQYLNVGDTVTSLQTLNPIYIDFYLPQQAVSQLKVGQNVIVTTDSFKGKQFSGRITTIQPNVDTNTRNVEVEATLDNPKLELLPGMYASVDVTVGEPKTFLTLPQSAITFNPYGDIVYVVKKEGNDDKNEPLLIARQVFVTTGETRGDQIQVLAGLKEGDEVVTSGQLKLKNNSRISVNNSVQPSNVAAPKLIDK
ncbi:Multidrug resistance protein MdtA [Aquicella siphonis]|uniref:Multidrug resistance protein MdtA n=1 Tax=Aquicella siphonis TaxID=254247 RepID=A0A5E4PKI1_9COXI|nr:efflux RND transporter periplasmic adaptor subunit [Aquicella siphonis]VVC77048.1 Multidrug resistance protein MdtA [Aquicella siphonis]